MQLTIKYFGMLSEATQCREEFFESPAATVSELLETLYNKYPPLRRMNFQVAQNHQLVSQKAPLLTGEVALLPPFSGG